MNNKQQTNKAVIQLMHHLADIGKDPLPEDSALQTQQGIAKALQKLQELNAAGRLQGVVIFGTTLPDASGNNFIHAVSSPPPQLARMMLHIPEECMEITNSLLEVFSDELQQLQQLQLLQAAENPDGKLNA